MSGADALLVFLGIPGEPPVRWIDLRDGLVVAQGGEGDPLPADGGDPGEARQLVAVLPGDSVAVHWIDLPPLAPAQALAAARLVALDASAEPLEQSHVALGPEFEAGAPRCMALVSSTQLAAWLTGLQELGLDPDVIIPETLLLPRPENGFVRHGPLYRGITDAFACEEEIARLVIGDAAIEALKWEQVEARLPEALAVLPINLRQGAFAKRRRWRIDHALGRRLVLLTLALLLISLAVQLASILRYTYAADAAERELAVVARRALPRAGNLANPQAMIAQRLEELRGGGLGYGAMAGALFSALRDTPNAELSALSFDRDGTLRATIAADASPTVAALQSRLISSGFLVESGPMRMGGGRQIAELVVRAR